MASDQAIALRRARATERIEASIAILAERFNTSLVFDGQSGKRLDPELVRANQLVGFADVLDQIVAATVPAEIPAGATPLVIDGVKPEHIDALAAAGLTTLDDVRAASDDELLAVKGIGPATVERIRASLEALGPA